MKILIRNRFSRAALYLTLPGLGRNAYEPYFLACCGVFVVPGSQPAACWDACLTTPFSTFSSGGQTRRPAAAASGRWRELRSNERNHVPPMVTAAATRTRSCPPGRRVGEKRRARLSACWKAFGQSTGSKRRRKPSSRSARNWCALPSCRSRTFSGLDGGADRNRTCDLLIANETLYQLSYDPNQLTIKRLRRKSLHANFSF